MVKTVEEVYGVGAMRGFDPVKAADDWRLVTPESERVAALRRERMELVARLEKIDAELARLTDGVECRPVAISMHHAGPHFQV